MGDRIDKFSGSADEGRFERLVDGELSAEEYRALLAALDEEPGAWRRCALAFLEHQALAGELRGISRFAESSERVSLRPADKSWGLSPTLFAVAVSFLFAFGLGVVAPRFFFPREQEFVSDGNLMEKPMLAVDKADGSGREHRTLRPVGNLRLIMDGSTDGGQVPVYEAVGEIEQYLAADNPPLGPELIELLRQRGYHVLHEQQYFPAATDDGRQIIVPVEGYQITPVSRRY
jgi:hypothetical protein